MSPHHDADVDGPVDGPGDRARNFGVPASPSRALPSPTSSAGEMERSRLPVVLDVPKVGEPG